MFGMAHRLRVEIEAVDPAIFNYTASAAPDLSSVIVIATRAQANALLRDREKQTLDYTPQLTVGRERPADPNVPGPGI